MRLNTYPGLKQGSTELTSDKRQADDFFFFLSAECVPLFQLRIYPLDQTSSHSL